MPYPYFSKAEARAYLAALSVSRSAGEEPPPLPETHLNSQGAAVDWDATAEDIKVELENLMASIGETGKNAGSEFETPAAPVVHRLLPEHPALADPEFWIWLAVSFGQDLVQWRYGSIGNHSNFGIGGSGENLFYRLWLRGEIGHTPGSEDKYRLARYGDIDFWRSHIFRQSYGDARIFARAFLEFQFPVKRNGKPRLKQAEVRVLAKHLKRARSNLLFEVMSPERATRFLETEWQRLESE
ncbi:hypothetical protein [Rhizobium ruizarguesonis]|uniref:hypothetical protein n=1 Tax=Rhizobium ruizarguesonis TaxID=2081791 RepID=UPI0010310DF0|nr:hypothetical protein [Rhizobium ruizarguesonis]TBF31492.1 hypothetical protein ELG93_14660 [Rhizobium ruizarguesonis]